MLQNFNICFCIKMSAFVKNYFLEGRLDTIACFSTQYWDFFSFPNFLKSLSFFLSFFLVWPLRPAQWQKCRGIIRSLSFNSFSKLWGNSEKKLITLNIKFHFTSGELNLHGNTVNRKDIMSLIVDIKYLDVKCDFLEK